MTDPRPPLKNLSLSGVCARGWTPALIRTFLGEPDCTAPNPRYRTAAAMKLYAVSRIEAAEQTDAFIAALAKARVRSEIGRAAAARQAARLVADAEAMPITVRALDPSVLRRRAIAHFNDRLEERQMYRDYDVGEPASASSDGTFLRRIEVNYVRHVETAYDDALESLWGRMGVESAVAVVRRRVYALIAATYPSLANECERQAADRGVSP